MSTSAHRFALRFREFATIDHEAGVIRDVSVITVGPALGHGVQVDATTLAQVKACAETYANGLKVKMTHEGDAGDIVGRLTNFRIEGDQLFADLHLLRSSPHRGYILELAETIPDTFGLSIAFSGPIEEIDEQRFARCVEIYSADIVSEPAANPTGLFDAGPLGKAGDDPACITSTNTQPVEFKMTTEEIQKIVDESLGKFAERLSKLESTITPPAEEKKPEVEVEMSAKLEAAATKGAEAALKLFTQKFGAPAVPVSAPAAPAIDPATQSEPKKFEDLVKSHAEYASNKTKAVSDTIAANRDAHRDYLARVRSGEVVLF